MSMIGVDSDTQVVREAIMYRLVNNEIIIGQRAPGVDAYNPNNILLSKVRTLAVQQRGNSLEIGFKPFGAPFFEGSPDGILSLNKNHIIQQEPANKEMSNAYFQAVSGIIPFASAGFNPING